MARPLPADSPAKAMSRRSDAVVQEGFIGRESVVDRCRIRVLGDEAVVDRDDLGDGPAADLRG